MPIKFYFSFLLHICGGYGDAAAVTGRRVVAPSTSSGVVGVIPAAGLRSVFVPPLGPFWVVVVLRTGAALAAALSWIACKITKV